LFVFRYNFLNHPLRGRGAIYAQPWPAQSPSRPAASASWPAEATARPASQTTEATGASSSWMNEQPWWERWPSVLEREENALRAANIRFKRDEDAFAKGILRLDLTLPSDLEGHSIYVVYPDLYPYFRFQAYAKGLRLGHHQHPFEHNLCLMPRRTHHWDETDTVAEVLRRQLPDVLRTAAAMNVEEVLGKEVPQAEPFSEYFRYCPSMILVDSRWSISDEHKSGSFVLGATAHVPPVPEALVRGPIIELWSEARQRLHTADHAIRLAFPKRSIEGRWARVKSVIRQGTPQAFVSALLTEHPQLANAKIHKVVEGYMRLFGVLFPEETGHRRVGEGWVFVGEVSRQRPGFAPQSHRKNRRRTRG
jgi:hypothetical protein